MTTVLTAEALELATDPEELRALARAQKNMPRKFFDTYTTVRDKLMERDCGGKTWVMWLKGRLAHRTVVEVTTLVTEISGDHSRASPFKGSKKEQKDSLVRLANQKKRRSKSKKKSKP